MGRIIGIDLGTTNSCVAVLEGAGGAKASAVRVVPNTEGSRTTPSVVGFAASGARLVGDVARRQGATNPANTVYSVKRLMGRKFADPDVQNQREFAPYTIVEAPNHDAWVEVHGQPMSPPEISATILAEMKRIAEHYLGEAVTEAVITVPAYFDDAQRQATKDAGQIAGLEVKRIINEPTAAALAYGLDQTEAQTVAVYDLGGGTFDISVMRIEGGVFSVKSTLGDTHLGGEDFDLRLVERLASEFREYHGVDLRHNTMSLQRLKEAAEKAKHELSSSLETEVNLPFISIGASNEPLHLARTIRRNEIEMLCGDLIDRTVDLCFRAVADAGLTVHEIDCVVLVGGMTRMPAVQQAVEEFFGKPCNRDVNPDEVVAVGASIQAAALSGEVDDVLLLDVTPLSIGVETGGGVMTKLIPRNTTIPTEATEVFTTSVDLQNFVPIHVVQGERAMAADCRTLAEFELTGIPPAPRGVPKIKVTFHIDADSILHVEATDMGTGMTTEVSIKAHSGLNADQIDQLVADGAVNRDADATRSQLAELRNQAGTLLYTTESALQGYADLIPAELFGKIQLDVAALRGELDAEVPDVETIRSAYAQLERAAFRIAESMYEETSS
ncbi:MAG: molecular chaperone DnaK [Myxococcales bacterium]|nr:molecular chaperone DnaK [Myxococcales bacterium]